MILPQKNKRHAEGLIHYDQILIQLVSYPINSCNNWSTHDFTAKKTNGMQRDDFIKST